VASAYLISAAPDDPVRFPKAFLDLEQLLACAKADRFGIHSVAADPAEADLVLFVEVSTDAGAYFERVRSHPLYRTFREKTYLFSSTDKFVPLLPGIYASLERSWFHPEWTRPGHYLGVRERGELRYQPRPVRPSYLFSFVGSTATHPLRRHLLRLKHPAGLLLDSSGDEYGLPSAEYERRYARILRQSAFVLCPRGGGTSTFRLFEAMMLGRVPVIVSDEWVPPEGPNWESFSVRVREAEIEMIPAMLAERQAEAEAMGVAARAAWLEWFSETTSFHRIIESCLQLAASSASRGGYRRYLPYRQMLRPYHAARWAAKRLGHRRLWSI
jgi:Exostosin family